VRAANAGVVSFAGEVANTVHVVVAHDGNLRTSYSFLTSVSVHAGQVVERGQVVGTAGGVGEAHDGSVLHFGLRVADRYVDPMQLFRPIDLTELVHLVPADAPDERPWTATAESTELRASLRLPVPVGAIDATDDRGCGDDVPLIGGLISDACSVAGWIGDRGGEALDAGLDFLDEVTSAAADMLDRIRGPLHKTLDLLRTLPDALARSLARTPPGTLVLDIVEMGRRFYDTVTAECDDHAPAADGTGGSGHRVMVVAGINSSGAAWDRPTVALDVKGLGYYRNEEEIRYFSYAAGGGAYDKADTHGDLSDAGARLLEQLRAMQAEEPGREVDLVGHSQGGIVIDVFLSKYYDPTDPTLPPLGNVITLSSPHEGAPLATTGEKIRGNPVGKVVLDDLVGDRFDAVPPPNSVAVGQLSEDSGTIKDLFPRGIPEHIDFTTIGATGDIVVPATNISVPGATETAVSVGGNPLGEHSAIVSDPGALRAVRAALEGRAPPCVSLGTALGGAVVPVLVSRFEHNAAGVVYFTR
ncbi:MAG: peptidoglycan DD-metalloendopeptidase family protein, partial [Acidimicrobiia bacterium]